MLSNNLSPSSNVSSLAPFPSRKSPSKSRAPLSAVTMPVSPVSTQPILHPSTTVRPTSRAMSPLPVTRKSVTESAVTNDTDKSRPYTIPAVTVNYPSSNFNSQLGIPSAVGVSYIPPAQTVLRPFPSAVSEADQIANTFLNYQGPKVSEISTIPASSGSPGNTMGALTTEFKSTPVDKPRARAMSPLSAISRNSNAGLLSLSMSPGIAALATESSAVPDLPLTAFSHRGGKASPSLKKSSDLKGNFGPKKSPRRKKTPRPEDLTDYYIVKRSDKQPKKYYVWTPDDKKVYFGAAGYEDYTMHHDERRKELYINRHSRGGENWDDPDTPGFWSRWLTWNLPTLEESARDITKRYGIKIHLDL